MMIPCRTGSCALREDRSHQIAHTCRTRVGGSREVFGVSSLVNELRESLLSSLRKHGNEDSAV